MTAEWVGPLSAFLSSCTWSLGSARYAVLTQEHSPFAVNLSRAMIAFPLFVIATFVVAGGFSGGVTEFARLEGRHIAWLSLSMFAAYGFGDALFLMSTRTLGVPGALAIASTYPLVTALGDWLLHGNSLGTVQLVGLLLMITGVIVVIMAAPIRERVLSSRGRWSGVALALVTSVFWSINSYSVARVGQDISPLVGNAVRMMTALFLSLVMGRLLFPALPRALPRAVTRRWAGTFAIESFGGSFLFMYGMAHSPLVVGTVLSSLSPVISVPIAWAMGLEKFSWLRTLGILGVVLGLALLMR